MAASLSGRYSGPGSQALAGAQAWADDANAAGGVGPGDPGQALPIRLTWYDDESDGRRCAELTERLIVQDRVDIVVGPYSSGLAAAAAAVARQHRRVLWNHGGASDAVHQAGGEWVVSTLTPARLYFQGVIDLVRGSQPEARRVAVVSSTAGAFPREVAAGAEEYARERGFTAVRAHRYPPSPRDFDPVLRQLYRGRPDLVLAVGRIEDDILFARQLVETRMLMGTVGLVATPLTAFRDALGDAAEGFIGPSQWEPGIVPAPDYGPASDGVMRRPAQRWPSGVDYPMAQAYAGCLVAQRCIEMAGSLNNEALRRVAGQLDFTTFYGRYKIDPATGHQLGHIMPVVRWERGAKVVVWPPGMRGAEALG